MPPPSLRSSRQRYLRYRQQLQERRRRQEAGAAAADHTATADAGHGADNRKNRKPRSRPFFKLLVEFWQLLDGYRQMLLLVLAALGISTLLGLVPLYGTKIVFDSVLRDQPLPTRLPHWIHVP